MWLLLLLSSFLGAREPGSQGAREPGSNNLTKLCIIKEFRGYYWRSYKG